MQDLAEEAPPRGFVGLLVVDPLAQRERLHQLGPRLLQRGLELRDRLVAELGAGEAELVLGGLHGVVEVDERAAGVVGEVVGRLAGGRVGERRGRRRGLRVRLRGCAAPAAGQHVGPAADHRDPADDEPDGQRPGPPVAPRAAGRLTGAQPVGQRDRRAGPVVRGQARADVLGLDGRDDRVGQRELIVERDAVGAVVDRDGQQRVTPPELRRLGGPVRPVLARTPGEALDVDDVEAHVGLAAELVQRRLHPRRVGPQCSRRVGDVAVDPERGLGRGRRASERQQPEHQRRDCGHPAHVHPRIRLPLHERQVVGT